MKKISVALLSLLVINVSAQNTFTTIYNTLQANCSSCHSGGSPAGGLNLSGNETAVYNALVEVNPSNSAALAKGDKLIDKGYPDRSFLLRKVAHGLSDDLLLTTGEGNNEPNGQTKLADQDIELIRQWVIYGAPQSGNVVSYQRLVDYYTSGGKPKITRPTPPPAGQGFQIHFGPVFWAHGQEIEYFKKYDPRISQNIEVNRYDVFMNSESHHFILRKYQPGASSSISDGLQPFTTGAFSNGKDFLNAWQSNGNLELPTGTGFFWDNNTVLDLNYHMLNGGPTGILPGEVYINVYTKPRGASTVEMKAELIPNLYIYIPNNNQNTTYSSNLTRSGQTWNIWMLSTHTHKYGIDYDIFERNSNGSQGTQRYEGHYNSDYTFPQGYYSYSHPPVRRFSPMLTVNMSNGLTHKATWKNDGPQTVTWGFTTNDEMMLIYVQYTTQAVNYKPPVTASGNNPGCDPVTLTTDEGLSSYAWSNGETTPSITVSSSGTYRVTVTDGSGSTYTSDPLTVTVSVPTVSINSGNDPAICSGQSATLNAGSASSYAWSTGATTSTIPVSASGNYNVTITDANGCTATDVSEVSVFPLPVVNILDVTTCSGSSVTFDAGNPGSTYAWSNGATAKTITVSQAAMYSVTVTNANGCINSDQGELTLGSNLSVNVADESICDGQSVTLDAGFPGSIYNWSNGATTQTISVNVAGSFSVSVDDPNGCDGLDAATVTILSNPVADAGEDKAICDGNVVDLTATGGVSYSWSNGLTGQTITVSQSDSYNVTVTAQNGCSSTDKTDVSISLVNTSNISGNASVDAGSSAPYSVTPKYGSTYNWTVTNGNITSGQGSGTLDVNWGAAGSGTLSVVETNEDGCSGSAVSFQVSVGAVGIASSDLLNEIIIYPNPFSTSFKITFPFELYNYSLNIHDITGKMVYSIESVHGNEVIIHRESLSEGIYFVEVKGDKVFRGKVVLAE